MQFTYYVAFYVLRTFFNRTVFHYHHHHRVILQNCRLIPSLRIKYALTTFFLYKNTSVQINATTTCTFINEIFFFYFQANPCTQFVDYYNQIFFYTTFQLLRAFSREPTVRKSWKRSDRAPVLANSLKIKQRHLITPIKPYEEDFRRAMITQRGLRRSIYAACILYHTCRDWTIWNHTM